MSVNCFPAGSGEEKHWVGVEEVKDGVGEKGAPVIGSSVGGVRGKGRERPNSRNVSLT